MKFKLKYGNVADIRKLALEELDTEEKYIQDIVLIRRYAKVKKEQKVVYIIVTEWKFRDGFTYHNVSPEGSLLTYDSFETVGNDKLISNGTERFPVSETGVMVFIDVNGEVTYEEVYDDNTVWASYKDGVITILSPESKKENLLTEGVVGNAQPLPEKKEENTPAKAKAEAVKDKAKDAKVSSVLEKEKPKRFFKFW